MICVEEILPQTRWLLISERYTFFYSTLIAWIPDVMDSSSILNVRFHIQWLSWFGFPEKQILRQESIANRVFFFWWGGDLRVLLELYYLLCGFCCHFWEVILASTAEGWKSETGKKRKSVTGTKSCKILLWQLELSPNEEIWETLQSESRSYSKR